MALPIPNDTNSPAEVLNSWKEIAAYMKRGVRTVQRWEQDLRLPVRRPRGAKRSAVIALRSELDLWCRLCPATSSTKDTCTGLGELFDRIIDLADKTRPESDVDQRIALMKALRKLLDEEIERLNAASVAQLTTDEHDTARTWTEERLRTNRKNDASRVGQESRDCLFKSARSST